ncbi:MAG TPA: tetratricopeptide repeat protein [Terriglobales bacterium]|nr:tetratricopeptide repeat protein [Terriglobales bacterium]
MSKNTSQEPVSSAWSSVQAYSLAVVCLLLGVAVGYFLRGSAAPAVTAAAAETAQAPAGMTPGQIPGVGGSGAMTPQMIDQSAQPMIEALKQNPNDVATLAKLGNLYYDSQLYQKAIEYYGHILKIQPENVDVRTDMGTAMFYLGDTDGALKEFDRSLSYNPAHPGTLFNMGVVKWQGKKDPAGAIKAWETLLSKNPNYPEKDKVQQLITHAKDHSTRG